ncbi:hypothetical protein COA17_11145 [Sphingomonas ginsenosidimutans]|jgi:hypothetical protein|uniref:Uncharacterized protein n=1 Tax=Sphingomonas ginsenosidimutans TaxID=862134 RepID=A0A2A4HWG7_9SPHN|nr:hypothetical protein [Sphingomonas ginsenosidimutans]PCG08704.1 hypothetical protein COA17_11145 [Sphingomonas ginsenosidimutans]
MASAFDRKKIWLACAVLRRAAWYSTERRTWGPAERLALRTLVPFADLRRLTQAAEALAAEPRLWSHARLRVDQLIEELQAAGLLDAPPGIDEPG